MLLLLPHLGYGSFITLLRSLTSHLQFKEPHDGQVCRVVFAIRSLPSFPPPSPFGPSSTRPFPLPPPFHFLALTVSLIIYLHILIMISFPEALYLYVAVASFLFQYLID